MRRRYMHIPLVTHTVKAIYQDGVEVLVDGFSVGFISNGQLEWLAPKYKGTVKVQLVNPKTITTETETVAQIALIYYCVDNSFRYIITLFNSSYILYSCYLFKIGYIIFYTYISIKC